MKKDRHYPEVDPQPDFPRIEEKTLALWKREAIFRESVTARPAGAKGSNEYVFYDGPPFANGLPHYGHLVTGYVKDIVPRYQTMKGHRVERRFGWDCHGLPAEMEAEKELGISGHAKIDEYGVDRFNDYCRKAVLRYTNEWEDYVTRQARWVDFQNDYKTMDLSYMESVIWAFKKLHEKGLVYEGYRVLPYSWACETPVSNFETRIDNSFRERQDPAITVLFTLDPRPGDPGPLQLLVWTTTPWTLPSNLALAVGPEIEYAVFEEDGKRFVLGAATVPKYEDRLGNAERTGTIAGADLIGRTYHPLFPYFRDTPNAFRVLSGDFVDTEEGTGIVHMAPGFGEDDQRVCEANDIPIVCPVDNQGRFTAEVTDYAGMNVFDANKAIIRDLKAAGVLVKHETYLHNYPHCWRTDTPLIYRAMSSWYVQVTAFRDRMVELNQEIRWIPEHVRDGAFGKWLENARDWSISRNRFWGTPIPVWRSDDPAHPRIDVYGSLDELERDFGVRPDDLHRPGIDELTRPNPDDPSGRSTMRRVEQVFDCWFESGAMPFAQIHYPFENQEWFDEHFPADFIVEYIAQTRGWFYTLMVLGVALFDRPPFRNCVCHGIVLDENGQKLSKRLRNYPSPEEVFSTQGADALRWFLVSSPILRGGNLVIDRKGSGIAEAVRRVIIPLWNAYYFFCLYANADAIVARECADSSQLLDRYILAKTRELIESVENHLDGYDIPAACADVMAYIDALNNWYIRRSRDRFWKAEKDQDKQHAYDTLFTALTNLTRACAPLLPLISEEIYRGLTRERSVHLTDWPVADRLPAAHDLVAEMDRVREVCSTALAIRKAHKLRVRQPLRALTIAGREADRLAPYFDLIRDEVNVKEVRAAADMESFAGFRLKVNPRSLGPRLGAGTQKVIAAARAGDWRRGTGGTVEVGGEVLETGEYELLLEPKPGLASQALPGETALVALDIELTDGLIQEGMVNDVVRLIQQKRKEADLHVSDRIHLWLSLPAATTAAVSAHQDYVAEQTLATEIELTEAPQGDHRFELEIDGERAAIGLSRV